MQQRFISNFDTELKALLYDHDAGTYQKIKRDKRLEERYKGMGLAHVSIPFK